MRAETTGESEPRVSMTRRWMDWAGGHKRLVAGLVVGAVGLIVFVLVWFQPQKLFIDVQVDEALPAETTGDGDRAEDATNLMTEGRGDFKPLGHRASGRALLVKSAGNRIVRFEGFNVENGPDLVVYLSSARASGPEDNEFARDFVDLGQLKGNVGSQNYAIPSDTDLDRYRTVVIWCRRFNVAFAAAELR